MGIFQQFPYSNFHEMNLDQIIKIMREMQDEWTSTKAEWASYKDFIDNYFANLNLDAETEKALRILIADGTLDSVIDPVIASEVTAWLNDHITQPTSPAIDTSLTIAGAAADSKAVGDRFIVDEKLLNSIKYIHQYNYKSYESFTGFYNGTGTIVSNPSFTSYIVPIAKTDRYVYVNNNISVAALDENKNFLGLLTRTAVSSSVQGAAITVNSYLMDLTDFSGAVYVSLPYNGGPIYLRSASRNDFIPILPINADATCEEYEILFENDNIISPYNYANFGSFTENYTINMTTGVYQSWTNRNVTGLVSFKKGTVITSKASNVSFTLRGLTANHLLFVDTTQRHVVAEDFVGIIDYTLVGWLHPGYAPQNMSALEETVFLKTILPEEVARNEWNGKSWYCYGTSLSDIGVDDSAGNNGYAGKYPLYVDELSGLVRTNGAIGSGGITTDMAHGGNVLQALLNTPFDVDLVTLECLPNDGYNSAAHVGNITDTGTTTICGAFKTACEYITQHTRARMVVIFVTNYITDHTDPMEFDHMNYINAKNKLKEIAKIYGVEIIDAEEAAIDYGHRVVGLTYIDGIHLNYLGGEIVGTYVWNKLKQIRPYPEFQQ